MVKLTLGGKKGMVLRLVQRELGDLETFYAGKKGQLRMYI